MRLRKLLAFAILIAAAFTIAACSDVGYNPYVQNDARRPVGKTIEGGMDAAGNGVDCLDARFENAYY